MNVFFPYLDLKASVSCLDSKRLGNQVYREGLTLIRGGWPNHPASKIWENHKHALAKYCLFGLDELKRRGRDYPHHRKTFEDYLYSFEDTGLPPIIDEKFCLGHRSNLIRKNKQYYQPIFGFDIPDNLPYVWPTKV